MRRIPCVAALVIAAMVLSLAGPATAASTAPAYPGDFPDPSVVKVGSSYWAYSTESDGRNVQAITSTDLKTWSSPIDALPLLPTWAERGFTWAPGVLQRGLAFLMFYTVRDRASHRQCISVARSILPTGPFIDTSNGPLVCQLDHSGSIDPSPFVAPGTRPISSGRPTTTSPVAPPACGLNGSATTVAP